MPVEAAALVAALVAAIAPAAPPLVELRPSRLTLGYGERARVVVRAEAGPPRIVTSAGVLGPLREVAPGTWEAELEPPLETHPQLALVAAVTGGGVAFSCLPLVGRGVAVAHTEPNARIAVRIRDREFGPSLADASGRALVPVEVPPGERFAWHRGKALDLRVPPLGQVLLVVDPAPARADVEEAVTLHAFAVTPQGTPWAGAPISLRPSAGRLEPAREVSPGVFAARWILPPAPAGELRVEARLPDAAPAVAELPRPPGPASRVSIQVAERVRAGDAPLEVVVETSDAAGNPVDGDVRLTATFGELGEAAPVSPGVLRARWRVPERLDGRTDAVLEAALGKSVDRRRVALVAADPATLAVELARSELPADGTASADATVTLADRFGNGAEAPAPRLEASRGTVGPPSPDGPGRWRARYAPAWSPRGGEDAVVARAGDLVARAPVRLLEAPRQLTATVRAGALHAFGGFTAPYLGAAVEAWPLRLGGAWGFALAFGRVATTEDEAMVLGDAVHSLSASSSRWPVEATVLARRPLRPRLAAIGGAGVGLVRVHAEIALDGERTAEEWGWAPGLHASGGVAYELPSLRARVRLEATLGWQADADMETLRGALGTFGLALGVSHDAL